MTFPALSGSRNELSRKASLSVAGRPCFFKRSANASLARSSNFLPLSRAKVSSASQVSSSNCTRLPLMSQQPFHAQISPSRARGTPLTATQAVAPLWPSANLDTAMKDLPVRRIASLCSEPRELLGCLGEPGHRAFSWIQNSASVRMPPAYTAGKRRAVAYAPLSGR